MSCYWICYSKYVVLDKYKCLTLIGLGQIPNQPIVFSSDPSKTSRSEDDMIAWTWKQFLMNTSSPEWLARLPMTKAVVRAMDTIQSFTSTLPSVGMPIRNFIVAGGSKRGWTTWTTAAVDKRVVGMIPIVMPMGHMELMITDMFRVYGEWSWVLKPYVDAEILQYLGKPEFEKLTSIIDPLVYYNRYKGMPKYLISGSGDEFFLPDATKYFWDQLPEPKQMLNAPNGDHTLITVPIWDVVFSAQVFIENIFYKRTQPIWNYKSTYSNTTASITATASGLANPSKVYLWQATTISHTQRDYRLLLCGKSDWNCINPVFWYSTELDETYKGSRTWKASVSAPEKGWTGFLIEAVYPDENGNALLKETTSINIVPDILPFESCQNTNICQPSVPWNPPVPTNPPTNPDSNKI